MNSRSQQPYHNLLYPVTNPTYTPSSCIRMYSRVARQHVVVARNIVKQDMIYHRPPADDTPLTLLARTAGPRAVALQVPLSVMTQRSIWTAALPSTIILL